MATTFLAPRVNQQFLIPTTGLTASGAQLFCYAAGTTTKTTVYKDNAAAVSWVNPIVLDAGGNIPSQGEIWQSAGVAMKYVFAPSNDTDPPASPYATFDNITGINDFASLTLEWVPGPAPTFIGATQFTLVGDQTGAFQVGRRVKTTNTGGTVYGYISASAFTSFTTVTVVNDSGSLDSGLSAVSYGLLSATNNAVPSTTLHGPFTFAGQGVQVGSPTGGNKGSGTINVASTIYQNNDPVVTLASNQTITGTKTFTGPNKFFPVVGISSNTSLTASFSGFVVESTTAGLTHTLNDGVGSGTGFWVASADTNNVILQRQTTAQLIVDAGTVVTSYTMNAGSRVFCYFDGVNWLLTSNQQRVHGNPTGGDPGVGKINTSSGLQVNGSSVFNIDSAGSMTAGVVPIGRLSAATANSGYPQSGTGGETLRIVRGNINGAGTITNGTGFSVIRNSAGNYTVVFTTAFSAAPTMAMGANSSVGNVTAVYNGFPGTVTTAVLTFVGVTASDVSFSFIAAGPA